MDQRFYSLLQKKPKNKRGILLEPEMYLEPSFIRKFPKEKVREITYDMPLNFGWAPMSLFKNNGIAKVSVNSFSSLISKN